VSWVKALSVLVSLLFLTTGGLKIFGVPWSLRLRDQLGLPPNLWRAIGVLEWAGAVGLLAGLAVPILGILAAVGLCALMLGAITSRLRVHDTAVNIIMDLAVLALVALDLIAQDQA
jgi:uncharacterized membrane protein YphA (DoxX/SURF4 family)